MSVKGQRIGYVRVSSFDQNVDRQLEHLHVDRVFTDKESGKDTERPQLQALFEYARDGDTIVVHSMDRLARNTQTGDSPALRTSVPLSRHGAAGPGYDEIATTRPRNRSCHSWGRDSGH